tara:strand:- start:3463 stop:4305 length:843 start_codon:yes stop_codon:yes gene_type:complete
MKIILGDNQFFGVNHFDLEKGQKIKSKFDSIEKINEFINKSLKNGLDGFMINSNEIGYNLVSDYDNKNSTEIHYSIPYPHKYANMVNENGMISLFGYLAKNTSILKNIFGGIKLISTKNMLYVTPLALDLEIPDSLPNGSYIYMQNIITDLLIGLGRTDIIIEFIRCVVKMGYNPGIITLNPILFDKLIKKEKDKFLFKDLILCFNLNKQGFNVFPSLSKVEEFVKNKKEYKLMGMSIFASGGANIKESINYIKKYDLDYVVFGSSRIENIKKNIHLLRN